MTIVTGFFLITSHSVKWIHGAYHRHELLFSDTGLARIQIMNRLRYSEKRPIQLKKMVMVSIPSNWRRRVYQKMPL